MEKKDIGIRIKEIRGFLGLKQGEFSLLLGIRQNYLSRYEAGEHEFTDDLKFKLVDIVDQQFKKRINLNWFIFGEGEMFLSKQEKPLENIPKTEEKHPLVTEIEAVVDKKLEKIENKIAQLEKVESKIAYIESRLEKTYPDAPDFDTYISEPEPEYLDYVDDIAAGRPIYASEDKKTIPVPKHYIKTKPEDYYAGHIRGTSMIAAGIPNGALVLIRKSDFPRHNAIQVVECQGEVTLKRMREIPGKGWRICFDDYSEDFLEVGPEDEFHIQGDFVAIIPEDE